MQIISVYEYINRLAYMQIICKYLHMQKPEADKIKTELRDAGLKATPSRIAVLEALYKEKKPVRVQTIAGSLKAAKTPDLATVYRILKSLTETNLIREVYLTKGVCAYEVTNQPHHHHLVCEKCGLVEDITVCCEDPQPFNKSFHEVNGHRLEFSGICNACAA